MTHSLHTMYSHFQLLINSCLYTLFISKSPFYYPPPWQYVHLHPLHPPFSLTFTLPLDTVSCAMILCSPLYQPSYVQVKWSSSINGQALSKVPSRQRRAPQCTINTYTPGTSSFVRRNHQSRFLPLLLFHTCPYYWECISNHPMLMLPRHHQTQFNWSTSNLIHLWTLPVGNM